MENKILLLVVFFLTSSCYNEQKLKQILPLLDVKTDNPQHVIPAYSPVVISTTIKNIDLDDYYLDYDILVGNGEAQESTLGISGMYEVSENEWEIIYFMDETGKEVEVLTQEVENIQLGKQITINNEFIFEVSGTYKFIFYADYYDVVKERDEVASEKKKQVQKNITIKVKPKDSKEKTKKIVLQCPKKRQSL